MKKNIKILINRHAKFTSKKTQEIPLSKRQIECLHYVARGKTAKQIAKLTKLSHRTIEFYIENIKTKLNCDSRADLIEVALQTKVIQQLLLMKIV